MCIRDRGRALAAKRANFGLVDPRDIDAQNFNACQPVLFKEAFKKAGMRFADFECQEPDSGDSESID